MKKMILSGLILGLAPLQLMAQNNKQPEAVPPQIPVETFARPAIVTDVVLSRDGQTIAYESGFNKDWKFILRDWDTAKATATEVGSYPPHSPIWVNEERVIYGDGTAMNRNGTDQKSTRIYTGQVIFSRFEGDKKNNVLAIAYDAKVMGFFTPYYYVNYPRVIQVDTLASLNGWSRVEYNPGNITSWLVDGSGAIRVATQADGPLTRVVARKDSNSPWLPLPGLDWADDKFDALELSKDGQTLYLAYLTADGTKGLYTYDVKNGRLGPVVLSHNKYDIGIYDALILAPATRELLGVNFYTSKPVTVWLDEGLKAVQAGLDQVLPNKVNSIVSMSDDLQRLIVLSQSDRDPGTYYQFDRKKVELKPLFAMRPGLKAEQLARTQPISFKARDGLLIHGYLTLPVGRAQKHLPLIVFPHDGPTSRDIGLYSTYVQFLANRGYAVLQVNYRGSYGYGTDFKNRAKQRIGREPQDDITDAARWAVANGLADPKRMGIFGEGIYGGYSAIIGLMRNPDLYCCAINIDGVNDWVAHMSFLKTTNAESYDLLASQYGDPLKTPDEMKDISPINHINEMKGALFQIYDSRSDIPSKESDPFVAALKKAGKNLELFSRRDDFDGIYEMDTRVKLFTGIEQFLAKYMPADPVPAAVAAK